jgi:alcohol dehydrogenase class IV
MIEPFIHQAMATRVIFGAGTLTQVGAEVERLGARRALVLSTPGRGAAQGEMVASLLGERSAGVFAGAVMHTPVEVTEQALRAVTERGADALVSVGGGSTIGLGKALALRTDLPQIVLPTTYAGSEMTPILGETRGGVKTTLKDARIQPETVIYDAELGLDLPASASATSGINAIAHAVEALYARDRNPVTSLLAEEGIACLSRALPQIIREPRNLEARTTALYGAWLCGGCLGMVGMALHHKLCHVLGGRFSLPHAEIHTIVLPHAVAYNAPATAPAMARLARALGGPDPAFGLFDLAARLGVRQALREIGMPADGIDEVVAQTLADPYWNPRPLERAALRGLLEGAWRGEPPQLGLGTNPTQHVVPS